MAGVVSSDGLSDVESLGNESATDDYPSDVLPSSFVSLECVVSAESTIFESSKFNPGPLSSSVDEDEGSEVELSPTTES